MTTRARCRLALALFAAAALGGLVGGCGTSYKLPTEIRAKSAAGQSTYQKIDTWKNGMENIQDILLTPGGELFLVFQDPVTRTGEVRQYPQSKAQPLSTNFPGLLNPTAICSGGNRIFVLDEGDSSVARTNLSAFYPGTTEDSCGYLAEVDADVNRTPVPAFGFRRPITDLTRYWHVREYQLDGKPLSSFTDTNFVWVTGVAADAAGRVYVAGIIIYCRVDPFSPLVRTLEYRYRIRRYEPGADDRFVVTDLGSSSWRRDPSYVLLDGTGFGSAKDPRGMQWGLSQGPALYFADRGNNQAQRYGDPVGGPSSFKLDFGGAGPDNRQLSQPVDVSVDSAGYLYVVDEGNQRVLRYDPDGNFVQRVDWNVGEVQEPLARPVAVAVDNRQVYIADRGAAQVLRFRRRD
jgi:DNA-binding beta-propeller fold protein YncE